MFHHGNWCGPGWTAGQAKDAKDMTFEDMFVPAVDREDRNCKFHDIGVRTAETYHDLVLNDIKFIDAQKRLGYRGMFMADMVKKYGPAASTTKENFVPAKDLSLFKKHSLYQEQVDSLHHFKRKKKMDDRQVKIDQQSQKRKADDKQKESNKKQDTKSDVKTEVKTENKVSATERSGSSTSAQGLGDETKVDPVRNVRLLPYPPTMNVVMPFRHRITWDSNGTATQQKYFGFRLNSIKDIMSDWSFTADAYQSANETYIGQDNTPMMYNFWSKIYRYYAITRTEYKVKIWMPNCADNRAEYSVWRYHHGFQAPPYLEEGTNIPVKDKYRRCHKHANWRSIRPNPNTGDSPDIVKSPDVQNWRTEYHDKDNMIELEGVWEPGDYYVKKEVYEDQYMQTWVKMTDINPAREGCTVIINPSDDSHVYGTALSSLNKHNFVAVLEIVYHVQLKDLVTIFQYPRENDDIAQIQDFVRMKESGAP